MNIGDKHTDKAVSAYPLFQNKEGVAMALRIQAGQQLKEHVSKSEALLLCISGHARFTNERDEQVELQAGDLVHIEPMVKHWVDGFEDSDFILLK